MKKTIAVVLPTVAVFAASCSGEEVDTNATTTLTTQLAGTTSREKLD